MILSRKCDICVRNILTNSVITEDVHTYYNENDRISNKKEAYTTVIHNV